MKIKLRKSPEFAFEEIEIARGTTIEEVYKKYKDEIEHPIMAARVDNRYEELTKKIEKACRIELIDTREKVADLIYEHGLIMIYLKATEDVLGRCDVEIENSLGKGVYTEIKTKEPITDDELEAIKDRMDDLVKQDLPFERMQASRSEMMQILESADLFEKKRLLETNTHSKNFTYYSLGGFINSFYGLMVPSTGYIKGFDVRRYRRGVLLTVPIEAGSVSRHENLDDRKLYAAFVETKKWQEVLGISYVTDLNAKVLAGKAREMIQLSEALHEKKIIEIAQMITDRKKRIILISGPSSSGKTTFARRLCVQLRVNGLFPLYMGTDDFFVDRDDMVVNEKGEKDFEGLSAVDIDMFNRTLNDLLQGKEADIPRFDFISGKKVFGERIEKIGAGDPIVIEGIHALNGKLTPEVKEDAKFKIYISPLTQLAVDKHNRISVTDARMLRRIVRDYKHRGHSASSTIKGWSKVREGEDVNIFPYNGEADVFFNSMHIYELGVLRKYAEPLLSEIAADDEAYAEARRMLRFLNFFDKIEEDDLVANNSILREFIGGSIFV